MKNKKKTAFIIAAVIIAAVIVSAALIIHNKNSGSTPLEDITISESVLPSHPLKIEDEASELTAAADSNAKSTADISSVKGIWWYLYNDEQKVCYAFYFGDNNRVDLAYFDGDVLQGEDYKSGYSVYTQDGENIILRYLPDSFPIKNFTFTVKDDKIYLNDEALSNGSSPSNENFIEHFN